MPKILLLIPPRNFNDTEYSITRQTLEQTGVQVTLTSVTPDEAVSMEGVKVTPDQELRVTNPSDYDGLVLVGGPGTPKLLDYPEVINTVRRFDEQGKLVAAICLAPIILAKAGVLKGILATVFPVDFAITTLKEEGATYSQSHVVEDDNIITADGPKVAREFADKILKKFNL